MKQREFVVEAPKPRRKTSKSWVKTNDQENGSCNEKDNQRRKKGKLKNENKTRLEKEFKNDVKNNTKYNENEFRIDENSIKGNLDYAHNNDKLIANLKTG